MFGAGGPAKFVMVLFCFSVTANVAPTIYSCGLSGQVVLPFLVRVPRYFLAIIVTAIYLPIAIVGSTHFYTYMLNFLGVLGYWTSLYLPPVLVEPLLFRNPVSTLTFPVEIWNKPSKLPWGLAFIVSACCVSIVLC
jgi:purine-cytosine permease-like protein